MSELNQWIKKLIRARVYFSRGMSWLSDLSRFTMFAVFLKIFNFFPDGITLLISGGLAFLIMLGGRYDIKKIKTMQYEAEFTSKQNPMMKRIDKGIKKLNRKKKGMISEKAFVIFIWILAWMTFAIPAIIAITVFFLHPERAWPLLVFGMIMFLPAIFFFSIPFAPQSWKDAPKKKKNKKVI